MLNKIKLIVKGVFPTKLERNFLTFLNQKPILKGAGKSQYLIEFSPVYSNIIGLYYFLKSVRENTDAEFISYLIMPESPWAHLMQYYTKKIYLTLGVSRFIFTHSSSANSKEVENYYNKININIKSKFDLERLEFDGVWVGDIIYDSYLRKKLEPTVDLNSPLLKEEICDAIAYYLKWKNYFEKNSVKAVVVSHTVYSHFTVISRLAIKYGLKAYQVNDAGLYQMSAKREHAYVEFKDFKKVFEKLDQEIQTKGINWAHDRFKLKFDGAVGVDMRYSKKSAWGGYDANLDIIKPSNKIKIFIAPHCFFDSPHPYGLNLFPDFWEWLDFLGKISEKTDYEWYLKTHPDFIPANIPIIEKIIKKYPKFKLLPSDTSHHYVIRNGVDFLLSVYGTIGSEYPYFNVPVINASVNNPHCAFNFNLHPQSISEYEEILLNLVKVKSTIKIDRDEIFKFYFMRFFVFKQSWVWGSYDEMLDFIGGANLLGSDKVIDYFFMRNPEVVEKDALKIARKFLKDDTYCVEFDSETLKF